MFHISFQLFQWQFFFILLYLNCAKYRRHFSLSTINKIKIVTRHFHLVFARYELILLLHKGVAFELRTKPSSSPSLKGYHCDSIKKHKCGFKIPTAKETLPIAEVSHWFEVSLKCYFLCQKSLKSNFRFGALAVHTLLA